MKPTFLSRGDTVVFQDLLSRRRKYFYSTWFRASARAREQAVVAVKRI